MEQILRNEIKENGYCYIENCQIQIDYIIIILNNYFDLNISSKRYDVLVPKEGKEYGKNTLSSNFGLDSFPLHTDGAQYLIPPRFVLLSFKEEKPSNTPTLLFDCTKLFFKYNFFFYNLVWFVKGNNYKFYTNLINKNLLDKQEIFRFNPLIMKCLSPSCINPFEKIIPKKIFWKENDLLILDNWRVLHGRSQVQEEDIGNRKISRVQLFVN